jgi:hypothetical protein
MPAYRLLLSLLCLGMFGACAGEGWTVNYAPGYARNAKRISVFGIKRDGLLTRSGWDAIGPNLSAPFNGHACDVGYGETTLETAPSLAAEVDRYVRANGVSDELLTQIAPAAKGDTIMVMTISGHPRSANDSGSSLDAAHAPAGRGNRGVRNRGGAGMPVNKRSEIGESDPFTVSALFYSVEEHHTVALVELNYTGTEMNEALNSFRAKLDSEFPGATCSGWDFSVKIDEQAIHALSQN